MHSYSLTTAALAGVAALAFAVPALAQPAAGAAPGTVDWTGVYVGLNAGWNGSSTQASPGSATTQQLTGVSAGAGAVTVPPATFPTKQMDYSSSSFAAGGQVGYNKQYGHIVLGLEGDMDGVNGHSNQNSAYALPATGLTTGSTVDIERFARPDWTSTIRGRVGWAEGPVMFYGTGGLAIAGVDQAALYSYTPATTAAVGTANPGAAFGTRFNSGANDSVLTGWTVGGGAEWALNRQVSIGAEYRHSDYGHSTYDFGSTFPESTSEAARLGFTNDQVLAKVNFRFGPGGF
jgi:outer membrane immunogenic protein